MRISFPTPHTFYQRGWNQEDKGEEVEGEYPEWRRHVQVEEEESNRESNYQILEAPCPLYLARKATRQRSKHQKIPGDGGSHREDEAGAQRRRGTRNGRTPQGMTGTWEQVEGGKGGGGAQSRDTAAEAGMRRGAQR